MATHEPPSNAVLETVALATFRDAIFSSKRNAENSVSLSKTNAKNY